MKNIITILLFVAAVDAWGQASLDYSGYHLNFYEEFDYPDPGGMYPSHAFKNTTGTIPVSASGSTIGHPIRDFWKMENGWWGGSNKHKEDYAVLVSPGVIRLNETKMATPYLSDGRMVYYEAGYLKLKIPAGFTDYSRNYAYGIMEARIKFPATLPRDASGNNQTSPISFWANGWDKGTEIDIFDISTATFYVSRNIDRSRPDLDWLDHPPAVSKGGSTSAIGDIPTWHVFSAQWTPSVIRYYIDGVLQHQIEYDTLRTYPGFYELELAIMPEGAPYANLTGQYMDIDWVKIWKPSCDRENNLEITSASGSGPFYQPYPVNGRLFKQEYASFSSTTPIVIPSQRPTIVEATAITINSNFTADQSTRVSSPAYVPSTYSYVDYTRNGFLEIRAIACGSDAGSWYRKGNEESGYMPLKTEGDLTYELSPNPNRGSFQVSLPDHESYDISVSSMLGSIVYQAKVSGALQHTLSIPELVPGSYLVTISNGHQKEVKRMVIIK